MSDKPIVGAKDYTKSNVMDQSDASALRLAVFEKENLELKQQLLQGNVERAQLQAQLQGDKIKEAMDRAKKNLDTLVTAANKKYGLDLSKEVVDLTTGAITRNPQKDEADTSDEDDGDND